MKKTIVLIALAAILIPTLALSQSPVQKSIMAVIGLKNTGGGGGETEIPTPTARWQLNNNLNDTGSTYNLTGVGTIVYDNTNKIEGSHAATFDVGDYAYYADNAAFEPGAGDFSIAVLVRPTYLTDTMATIFGKYNWDNGRSGFTLHFSFADSNQLNLVIFTNDYESTIIDFNWAPTLNTYYLIVISVDADAANEVTAWISSVAGTFGDQVNGTQYNLDDAVPDNTAAFMIGRSDDGVDDRPFYGQIDDFRWYKGTALSAAEAEAIYDSY